MSNEATHPDGEQKEEEVFNKLSRRSANDGRGQPHSQTRSTRDTPIMRIRRAPGKQRRLLGPARCQGPGRRWRDQ